MTEFVVTTMHPDMLSYIDGLQKKNAEALSFYPTQAFEREIEKGRIYLGLLNGEPCGYIYRGALRGDVRCHQVCIQYDARRRLYGAQIVSCMGVPHEIARDEHEKGWANTFDTLARLLHDDG